MATLLLLHVHRFTRASKGEKQKDSSDRSSEPAHKSITTSPARSQSRRLDHKMRGHVWVEWVGGSTTVVSVECDEERLDAILHRSGQAPIVPLHSTLYRDRE